MRVEVDRPRGWMSPAYEADVRPTGPLRPTVTEANVTSSAGGPGPSVRYEAHLRYEHFAGKDRVEDGGTLHGSFQVSGRPSVVFWSGGDIVGGVRAPSIEMGGRAEGGPGTYEVDLTSEARTFPVLGGASAEVYFNEIALREVVDVD